MLILPHISDQCDYIFAFNEILIHSVSNELSLSSVSIIFNYTNDAKDTPGRIRTPDTCSLIKRLNHLATWSELIFKLNISLN